MAAAPQTATTAVAAHVSNDMVAPPNTRSGPLSLDDMSSGALDVKAWLKVDKAGITVGADRTYFDEIPVTLDMQAVQYCYSVRYGNPAQYDKTYDKVTDVKGRPWITVLRHAQSIDPKASEFRSADVPFQLRGQLTNKKGDVVIAEDGDVLGHSIAVTGWKFYQKFTTELRKLGINPMLATIECDIVHEFQKNDKGEWGVLTFKNIKEV